MKRIAVCLGLVTAVFFSYPSRVIGQDLHWKELSSIPDPEGFAGSFGGVSNGALLVAGGANITGEKWGPAFEKKWYDHVFVLENPEGPWILAGRLPYPSGYGASISTESGVLCAGGSDANTHHRKVFLMQWKDGKLNIAFLPDLPKPCANMVGAQVGTEVYVAGGQESPDASQALHTFWKLDLQNVEEGWKELEPWPGVERMLAVAASDDKAFYLCGGVQLVPGKHGSERKYLRDAYRYSPDSGWRKLSPLPVPLAAAPSPALYAGGHFIILSGDDGSALGFSPVEKHPGFRRKQLIYDPMADRWKEGDDIPFSLVTTPVISWRGGFVLPGGEARPRVRTPVVWMVD